MNRGKPALRQTKPPRGWRGIVRSTLLIAVALASALGPSSYADDYRYERGAQVLDIRLEGEFTTLDQANIRLWIESTADALATVYGRWPRDNWQVHVSSTSARGNDPVPWAQVNRGDPDVVSFYIDASASKDRLIANWTAYHEFSHLLIPYQGWGDMWFSEGLASYYQNILRVRHGVFSEQAMWQHLYDGFVRGRKNGHPELSLHELSERRYELRGFMRMYWSGAWYFLAADVALRKRSANGQSLDAALQALNRCCGNKALSARHIAARLDRLNDEAVFVPLFDEVRMSQALPDFEPLLQELGVTVVDGVVRLDQDHPNAGLRRGIAGTSR